MAKAEKRLVFRDDGTILLKGVRASYLHVFEPWAKDGGDNKKFSGRFIMDAEDFEDEIKELRAWLVNKQKEAFKQKIKADGLFFRDGDLMGKEEYENTWYVAASEKPDNPPAILRPDKKPCKQSDDLVYSGAIVNVIIKPWIQDNKHGKKINANLLVVQHKEHGEKFGSGSGGGGGATADMDGLDEEEFDGANDVGGDDGFDD